VKRVAALLCALMLPVVPAAAGLSSADLAGAGVGDARGALLPDAMLERRNGTAARLGQATLGRAALLTFVDYTCRTLCGTTLAPLAEALAGLAADSGGRPPVLVLGLDTSHGPAALEAFRAGQVRIEPAIAAFEFLRGSREAVASLAQAAGISTAYDADRDQIAHPAVVLVLTPDRRIARALSPLALQLRDLRLALAEAGGGVGGPPDQVLLLCYGWDAARGIYTLRIRRIVAAGGLVTLLALGLGGVLLRRRERLQGGAT